MTSNEPESVPCGICGEPTPYTGTKRCDWCWELEGRLRDMTKAQGGPELGRALLATWLAAVKLKRPK